MRFELSKDFQYNFEEAIFLGVNQNGGRFPRTGVWITGIIHKEGPKYIKQLQEEYNEFAEKIGVGGMTYESMKKNIYYLREADVVRALSLEEAERRNLDTKASKKGQSRKYHVLTESVKTDWVDIEPVLLAQQPELIDSRIRHYREIGSNP